MNRACRNCQWWRQDAGSEFAPGECRGGPPRRMAPPFDRQQSPNAEWPMTQPNDWCGAFRMAERLAGGITAAEFEDAHRRMGERLAGIGKGTEQ